MTWRKTKKNTLIAQRVYDLLRPYLKENISNEEAGALIIAIKNALKVEEK